MPSARQAEEPKAIAGSDRPLRVVRQRSAMHRIGKVMADRAIVNDRPVTSGHDAVGAQQINGSANQHGVNHLRVDEYVPA
jgi:hypothetical protein